MTVARGVINSAPESGTWKLVRNNNLAGGISLQVSAQCLQEIHVS